MDQLQTLSHHHPVHTATKSRLLRAALISSTLIQLATGFAVSSSPVSRTYSRVGPMNFTPLRSHPASRQTLTALQIQPEDTDASRQRQQPYYADEWQQLAVSSDYERVFEDQPWGFAFLLEETITDLLNNEGGMGIDEPVQDAMRKAINLAQLSAFRFETPMAIMLLPPNTNRANINSILEAHFTPEMQHKIEKALYFSENQSDQNSIHSSTQQDKPQCFAVDLSPLFLETIDQQISMLLAPEAEPSLIEWVADLHQAAKCFYDASQAQIAVSEVTWQMLLLLVRAAVLNPVDQTFPKLFQGTLQQNESAGLKAATTAIRLVDSCPTHDDDQERYQQRLDASASHGSQTNPSRFRELQQPEKILVRAEAVKLLDILKEDSNINQNIAYFTTMKVPFIGSINMPTKEAVTEATRQHFMVRMAESIQTVLEQESISTTLSGEINFTRFINDWIDIYQECLDNEMAYYDDKVAVLLDRYYPVTAGRRI